MTQFPNDDPKLTAFLRQYRSDIPPAASNLEDQIMAALATMPEQNRVGVLERPPTGAAITSRRKRTLWLWLVPSAIVASILTVVLAYRLPTTQYANQQKEEDLASLEAFVEKSWDGSINDIPSTEFDPTETSQQQPGS